MGSIFMKKNKIAQYGIILLAALCLWGIAACSPDDDPPGTGALLTNLEIADEAVERIPTPLNTQKWDAYTSSFSGLEAEYIGDAIVPDDSFLANLVIKVTASKGAKINYATATGNIKPAESNFAAAAPITMSNGASLYIRVVSEDAKTTNYYRIRINIAGSSADLTRITVAGTIAMMGNPSVTWAGVTAGSVNMPGADKDNVIIAVTKANNLQQVSFAQVSKANTAEEPLIWNLVGITNSTTVVLATDGDLFCFKVVSEDKENTLFYKIELRIGHDATLGSLTIGTVLANDPGTPAATWDDDSLVTGEFLGTEPVPSIGGLGVVIAPTDPAAVVKYAYMTDETTEPDFVEPVYPLLIQFADEGFLYIQITSEVGDATLIYKIHAAMQQRAEIFYGMPKIGGNVIDPIWDTVEAIYKIERLFPGDTTNQTWARNPDTWGVAKALWDDEGLYVFWDVTDPTRAVANNEHTDDSIELFINEAYTQANGSHGTYAQGGSQYRVTRDERTSGDPSAAVSALRTLNKYNAWEKPGGTGYYVVMQAPWRFKSGDNKAYMFEDDGLLKVDMEFGFELQINACRPAGTRLGTLCWNNSATTNYQNASNYGVATLTLGNAERIKKAELPNITEQPREANYYVGQPVTAADLSVTVTPPYSGELSYQWWSANSATDTGAAIGSATSAAYTPTTTIMGDTWYWVVVTNTDTTASAEFQKASIESSKALVGVDADLATYNADYFLDFSSAPKRNATAVTGNYASAIVVDTPRLFINKYTKYTFVVKLYGANGTTEITPIAASMIQLKMRNGTDAIIGDTIYNIGQQNGTNSNIPQAILDAGGIAKLDFESSGDWSASTARFIEIVSIKFHKE
jgi:hypothetical protein